jgi:hypothetical protein
MKLFLESEEEDSLLNCCIGYLNVGGRTGGVGEWETSFAYCTQPFDEGAYQVTTA